MNGIDLAHHFIQRWLDIWSSPNKLYQSVFSASMKTQSIARPKIYGSYLWNVDLCLAKQFLDLKKNYI